VTEPPSPESAPAGGPPEGSATQRRTAVGAVVVVVLALGLLAAWVAVGTTGPADPVGAPPRPEPAPTAEGAPATPAGTPAGTPSAAGTGPLTDVDWAALRYPLDCAGLGAAVQRVVLGDVTGDGEAEAVTWVRCAAGAGNPPSALFAYRAGAGGAPELMGTLLEPREEVLLTQVSVEAGEVVAAGTGYSSPQVPRCCPDRTFRASWRWDGTTLRRAT
jgi:hypothetical protein